MAGTEATKKQVAERLGVNPWMVLNWVGIDEFNSNSSKQPYVEVDIDTVSTIHRLALVQIVEG